MIVILTHIPVAISADIPISIVTFVVVVTVIGTFVVPLPCCSRCYGYGAIPDSPFDTPYVIY